MDYCNLVITLITYLCVLLFLIPVNAENKLARGWGDNIDWMTLDDGKELAKRQNKPLMLVIHKSWCGACKQLKPSFAQNTGILERASKFVMVNTEDDEEPKDAEYAPDGGYIPRILFLQPDGQIRKDIYNEGGNEKYRYFYNSGQSVVASMDRAIKKIESSSSKGKEEL